MQIPPSLTASQDIALNVFEKIIQRGTAPPIDPRSELHILRAANLGERVQKVRLQGDLRVQIRPDFAAISEKAMVIDEPVDARVDSELAYDSEDERFFHADWLARELGPTAPRWFIPQAPLESLIRARGGEASGARRVDFLVVAPWLTPFVVEIDGQQHETAVSIDEGRDKELKDAGYDVVRIPVSELRSHGGPNLDALAARWSAPPERAPDDACAVLTRAASLHRFAIALLEAIRSGFLATHPWTIEIASSTALDAEDLVPYFELFCALDCLWGANLLPDRVSLAIAGHHVDLVRGVDGYSIERRLDSFSSPAQVRIQLEPELMSCDPLPQSDGTSTIVVRSAFLPVEPLEASPDDARQLPRDVSRAKLEPVLLTILQGVFAKENFREGQIDALTEILAGRDCAVLLPTGAGKSLIYQLAGLVLPGSTLIVDPLVALMEDQAEGLREQGIDRVSLLSSYQSQRGFQPQLLERIASGESLFTFVAPERMQQKAFRDALHQQAQVTPINFVVIDEAHCVSEWGHDFRTAYLNLGGVIRNHCEDRRGAKPSLLALTGTASRAVLRDVLIELEIDRRSDRSVIRPRSFDRKELKFNISWTSPDRCDGVLAGALRTLPRKFNVGPGEFYAPRGDATFSGIVFCPHVNGEHGVERVANKLASVLGRPPAVYSGSAPKGYPGDWEQAKRRAASDFKANREPVLVSTKAFGMGIDKANIRFVIHYGIPSSIEGYYQEVGRAGRDRERAECSLVAIDFDERRSRRLLDDTQSLEVTRQQRDSIQRSDQDDVTRQLFFHLNSFRGVDSEIDSLRSLMQEIGGLGAARTTEVKMGNDGDNRERAIHRLVVLGVLRDYTVDWGGRKYAVTVENATPMDVLEKLCAYVRRSQPARVQAIREHIRIDSGTALAEAIVLCARELIGFVYDTVERSRRRSLREMWLAAREGAGDPDSDFRRRILDYLTQGDIAPALEALVDRTKFVPSEWSKLLGDVRDPEDARELRGNAARLLSSYPDHPGLLIARAMSEAFDPTGDVRELCSNLKMALESAAQRYGTDSGSLGGLIDSLLRLCSHQRPVVSTALLATAEGMRLPSKALEAAVASSLRDQAADPGVRVLALARALDAARRDVNDILQQHDEVPHER